MSNTALAVAAHPDDIELMMSGTLFRLRQAGFELHYLNLANGCCGTVNLTKEEIIRTRLNEARDAASVLGAQFYPPLVDDIQIYYTPQLTARLCAVVRRVNPDVLLLQSPQDYMEDHMNASRLMVTAAFCRGMPHFASLPPSKPVEKSLAIYHALPWGLRDQLRQPIRPDFFVDVSSVMDDRRRMLACHRSQKEWLDQSQGIDNYLHMMKDMAAAVGKLSGCYAYAEGWRRHSHLGFADEDFDPLGEALSNYIKY